MTNTSINPNYFYNELSFSEVVHIYQNIQTKQRDQLEQTRIIAYNSILPHLKENTSINKFMPLPFDNDTINTPEISQEDQEKRFKALTQKLKLD